MLSPPPFTQVNPSPTQGTLQSQHMAHPTLQAGGLKYYMQGLPIRAGVTRERTGWRSGADKISKEPTNPSLTDVSQEPPRSRYVTPSTSCPRRLLQVGARSLLGMLPPNKGPQSPVTSVERNGHQHHATKNRLPFSPYAVAKSMKNLDEEEEEMVRTILFAKPPKLQ